MTRGASRRNVETGSTGPAHHNSNCGVACKPRGKLSDHGPPTGRTNLFFCTAWNPAIACPLRGEAGSAAVMQLRMIDPHVRHNIAAGHGHRGRRTHRTEWDWRTGELFLPAAQHARNDIEIAEEVIDAKQIRERGASRATDVVSGRQYCLHLVMGGRAEIFQADGDPGHVVVVRHLAGDKHVVAADERSDEAGVLGTGTPSG